MPHIPAGPCAVCGTVTEQRCSSCAKYGFDLFLCGREHQKTVWFDSQVWPKPEECDRSIGTDENGTYSLYDELGGDLVTTMRIIDDAADDNSPINFPDPSMLSKRAAALCGIRYAVFWHLDETGNGDTNQDKLNPFLLTTAATTRMAHALTKGYKQAAVAGFPLDKDWWIAFQVHALDFSTLRTRLIRIQQDKFTPKGFDLLAALAMKTHLAFCAQQIPKAVAARSPPEWVLREALPKALETLLHGTPLLETLQL